MNIFRSKNITLPVRLLKTWLVLTLTLLWAVASNHCKLEQIPAFVFLACCDHDESAPHQDNDCQKDSCSIVEGQLYKVERTFETVPAPTILSATPLDTSLSELPRHVNADVGAPDAPPSLLPRVWQFSFRTALPPRAPSALS